VLIFQKNQIIKVARVDISKKHEFLNKEGINADTPPAIFVHFEGFNYHYDGSRDSIIHILHFINKLINPVI
jgi:hypothetical protein